MIRQTFFSLAVSTMTAIFLIGCASTIKKTPEQQPPARALWDGMTNNAVAAHDGSIYSFTGLGLGKTWSDTSSNVFRYVAADDRWETMASAPGPGRLAATAATVGDYIYLFGGYTVAEDGSEVSTRESYRYDPELDEYHVIAPMLVPVDDALSLVYRDQYIYLVSGWHDDDNVEYVQIYDTQENQWHQATGFPGNPLFGHGGGIVDNTMLVCGGVIKVVPTGADSREFRISHACHVGEISRSDPTHIAWRQILAHPGKTLYRSASTGIHIDGKPRVVFAGGTDNPYNYDGIGYNGEPAQPTDQVWSYNLDTGRWEAMPALDEPSMDHRGLPEINGVFYLPGGLDNERRVRSDTTVLQIAPLPPAP